MILYSLRSIAKGFLIAKFDSDFNVEETYEVELGDKGDTTCTCPGWPRKQKCKHTKMVRTFVSERKVDTDWFYDYDKGDWHQPLAATADQVASEDAVDPANCVASSVEAEGPTETVDASLCPECGKPGAHFAPPSFGMGGFFICNPPKSDSPEPATFRRRV